MPSDIRFRTIGDSLSCLEVPSPTIPPATHTNSWILGTEDSCVIVDPAANTLKNQAAHLNALKAYNVKAILLTHHHYDHQAGAKYLQKHLNVPIWAHELNVNLLPFVIDRKLKDGEIIELGTRKWTVRFTPGHAPGHIVLIDSKSGDCVCGDMVAGTGTILLNPPEGNLQQYLDSLQLLLTNNIRHLHPAHGPSIRPAQPYIQHYIDHRNMRTEQILKQLSSTAVQPDTIATKVYPDLKDPIILSIAARQIICHLNWLVDTEQASESKLGWTAK